jgi:hypothetical protein
VRAAQGVPSCHPPPSLPALCTACRPAQLSSEGPKAEVAGGGSDDGDGDGVMANYTSWQLPSREFEGLWESLVYDDKDDGGGGAGSEAPLPVATAATAFHVGGGGGGNGPRRRGVKEVLLSYAASALAFSDAHVDANLVSWNHVVLLHGPPGTGCVGRKDGCGGRPRV